MSDQVRELKQEIRRGVLSESEYRRRTAPNMVALPDDFIQARKEFAEKWIAMCEEGERKGYLEWTNDYPGSHLAVTEHTEEPAGLVPIETEDEHTQRVNTEVNRRLRSALSSLMKTAGQRTW